MSGQIRTARLSRRGALRAPVYPSGCTVKCDSRSADDEVNLELHQEDVRARVERYRRACQRCTAVQRHREAEPA